MKPNTKKWLIAAGVLAVLALAFWYGGGAPGLQGWSDAPQSGVSQPNPSIPDPPVPNPSIPNPSVPNPSVPNPSGPDPSVPNPSVPDVSKPSPSQPTPEQEPEAVPSAQEPQDPASDEEPAELVCTLSIRCDTVLDHLDWLDGDKQELIPQDGVILDWEKVPFEEGETVFDLLQRQTRAHGIHMEATFTPGYGSSYVEGIANLYEFDCGQQSGWVYLVNGVSPGYGSSQYVLSSGDRVEWAYTCDLGHDVGAAP